MTDAAFTTPVKGTVHIFQPKGDPLGQATIVAELAYAESSRVASMGHSWHVHQAKIKGSDCASAQGHYNPFALCLNSSCGYAQTCGQHALQPACEIGDLAGKHGSLALPAAKDARRQLYTDLALPLSGPESVAERSIVLHAANGGSARIACATLGEPHSDRKPRLSSGTLAAIVVVVLLLVAVAAGVGVWAARRSNQRVARTFWAGDGSGGSAPPIRAQ